MTQEEGQETPLEAHRVLPAKPSNIQDTTDSRILPTQPSLVRDVYANSDENFVSDEDATAKSSTEGMPPEKPLATVQEVFFFIPNRRTKIYIGVGLFFACCSGVIFPALAWLFSGSFSDLSASVDSEEYLRIIRNLAFSFMILGVVAFMLMSLQSLLLELAATEMTRNFKTLWFQALLRQDMAYFDLRDISGTATTLSSNAIKFKKGVGRKLADGVQFAITVVLGLVYGFWSSWQVSLVVLTVVPFMALAANAMVKMTTTQTARANSSYAKAGSIVYTAISQIRTILSLNAVDIMIDKYTDATQEAYEGATEDVLKFGFANGAMMASFLLSYVPVVLYGSYLIYSSVQETGCDPSSSAIGNEACDPSGEGVFGALFGITFAGSVLPQITGTIEAFSAARSAAYPALVAIYRTTLNDSDRDEAAVMEEKNQALQRRGSSAPLPKYAIDSSSPLGLKPKTVTGNISFKNVTFSYPSRMEATVFNGFSLDVPSGKTVALCGVSGGGKSTVVQLLERFYDVTSGSITLDGHDLRSLNVQWLRSQIGVIFQEPKLFALSIRENIAIGCPGATQEMVEEAARKANAHDFISSFADGYNTPCGDGGAQLSGGQKQRIAIARVLINKPKIILLDEATSALDSESEAMVQEALDGLMHLGEQTVIVIAHRLATIKGADMIVVVSGGKAVEMGTHSNLLSMRGAYYDLVEAQKGKKKVDESSGSQTGSDKDSNPPSRSSSYHNLQSDEMAKSTSLFNNGPGEAILTFRNVHFHYPSRPGNKVFRGLNLAVKNGETLAIVGPSGQGKSTVIQLIEQFYRPTEGTLEFCGVDMKELNIRWCRQQIATVFQEPNLFDSSIAENIRFGCPNASQSDVEDAARKANAHDFILSFPDGYATEVGGGSSLQVSGGQKQRIAIARSLLRKPSILLLDEATSALDSASEQIVQEALDRIMADKSHTTIVIAHRLSTLRNVDRIAYIENGKIRELGTHNELMSLENGRYKRLQSLQNLDLTSVSQVGGHKDDHEGDIEDDVAEREGKDDEIELDKETSKKNAERARLLAKGDGYYFAIGAAGAILAGIVFPSWGLVFAYMVLVLYYPVQACDDSLDPPVLSAPQFETCQAYWDDVAAYQRDLSFKIFYGLLGIMACSVIGNIMMYAGFGTASERMNKRVRDSVFKSMIRFEVAWFDVHPIGKITTRLSEDAALMHSFSGQPIRMMSVNVASVLIGLVLAFVYMWPFALITLAILPFMSLGKALEIQAFMGDEQEEMDDPEANSSAGIVVESLLDMRTVSALCIQEERIKQFDQALDKEDPHPIRTNFIKGSTGGVSQIVQMWGFGLMFWFGGWLLFNYPNLYTFQDLLISMFGMMFGMTGIGIAMQDMTDSKKASEAAERIFEIIDRKSEIDPLSEEGKKFK